MEKLKFKKETTSFGRYKELRTVGVATSESPEIGQYSNDVVNIFPLKRNDDHSDSVRLSIHKEDIGAFVLHLCTHHIDEEQLFSLVDSILAMRNAVAIPWTVEDVNVMRPDLDDDQCLEVLDYMASNHDAGVGINWEVIETTANDLFGTEKD